MAKEAVFGPPTKWEGGKPPDRLVRPTMPMAGWGGFVEIGHPAASEESASFPGNELWKLEVQQWRCQPIGTWVEIPMCGGLGAMTRRPVCTDVAWKALLVWDAAELFQPLGKWNLKGTTDNPIFKAFPDSSLRGTVTDKFLVSLFFQLGEPDKYPDTDGLGAYYYVAKASLETFEIFDDSSEDRKAIQAVASGKGSSPLTRWLGQEWRGAFGFGFSKADHGFSGANSYPNR